MITMPRRLNFILTNRCNLRCTYCPEGSHPQDYYADLDEDSFDQIVRFCRENHVQEAGMAYYGELTLVRDWWQKAQKLLDIGVALTATTNGHLPLSSDEVATFARFRYIEFSIDSHDEQAVREVRKKTSVARIIHNFHLVRAYCLRHNMPVPTLVWTGVLTKHVVRQLPSFVAFAASNGVTTLNFNEVQIYDGAAEKGLNIVDLQGADFCEARSAIDDAMSIAERVGVNLTIQELPRIRAKQEGRDQDIHLSIRSTLVAPTLSPGDRDTVPEGYTRDCGAPWNELYLDPKGRVFACCNRGEVMGTAKTADQIKDVFSNDEYNALRASLEAGGSALDAACATCSVRPIIPLARPQPEPPPDPLWIVAGRRALRQLDGISPRGADVIRSAVRRVLGVAT